MKKILSLAVMAALCISLLTACGKTSVELDKAEHTFTAAGETVTLNAETKADELVWTSSDEAVATVANGVVTAVAPGTATITVTAGDVSATCTVKCEWEVNVDLEAFYNEIYNTLYPLDAEGFPTGPMAFDLTVGSPDFGISAEDGLALLDMNFPGLAAVETEQMHVYFALATAAAYEVVLVKVSNASDVDTVKNLLQARIDAQVSNQMNYPMVIEGWQNDSRIVTNGNYIMMAVGTDCDKFVDAFNGQF